MKKERTVREAILSFADRHAMLPAGTSVLVGFSGGADSVCLLSVLREIAEERNLRVGAVHLNHRLRGDAADRDERFCRAFCESRGIPFYAVSRDVAAYAEERKLGTEEAAREVRYAVFNEIADRYGYEKIATAHNADDQLETLLFRLARGTGIAGLRGIPPVRGRFLRPMLRVGKEEILRYLTENGLTHVTDETNADPAYTRNYIRSELVPRMKKVNAGALRAAADLSECAAEDEAFLASLAAEHSLSEGAEKLASLPDPVLRRVIRREAEEKGMSLSFSDTAEAMRVVRSTEARTSAPMPGRNEFRKDRGTLSFGGASPLKWEGTLGTAEGTPAVLYSLNREAAVFYAPEPLSPEALSIIKDLKNIYKLSMQAHSDSAKIGGTITLGSRLPGGIYRFGGMTRSVKKLFSDRKFTALLRDSLPVFTDADGILWIPGFPPREEGDSAVLMYFCTDPAFFPVREQKKKNGI